MSKIEKFIYPWGREEFEATYHAGELAEADRESAKAEGLTEADIMARVREWADDLGRTILRKDAPLADRLREWLDLHSPALSDAELHDRLMRDLLAARGLTMESAVSPA